MPFSPKLVIGLLHLPIFLTVGYAWWVYRSLGKELRSLAHFLFLSGVVAATSLVLWFFSINNMPILHFYVLVGFVCLIIFYREVLNGFINRKVFTWLILGFSAFSAINTFFFQPLFVYNSYGLTVEAIIIIVLSLSTFLLMLNDIVKETHMPIISSLKWINSGLFTYYSSSLLIFYFGDLISQFTSTSLAKNAWILHGFFSAMMYCFCFVGLWKRPVS